MVAPACKRLTVILRYDSIDLAVVAAYILCAVFCFVSFFIYGFFHSSLSWGEAKDLCCVSDGGSNFSCSTL